MAHGAVAVWQMAPTIGDLDANLRRLADTARTARDRGATILVAPELCLTGYDIGPLDDASTAPDLVDAVAAIAADTGIALVMGLALREEQETWNASVIVDRCGRVRAIYRKTHLFGDLDRSRFSPGPGTIPPVDLDGIRVGTVICYDIEFPEPARLAALAGAHVLAVPTANMTPWTFINEHVIPVRAFENQLYVAYANHIGTEGETTYVGHSVIAAPDGTTVRADALSEDLLIVPIDPADIDHRRARVAPYLSDRRPALYHALSEEDR
ncbi:MAG: carbon-nitrogen hydrolase family protein [Tetrasphaera sp.]|jgi:predicted amidohydrolase|nr:carbon-nitrogen hydrolase family protein [Tetrasphaera sp.]